MATSAGERGGSTGSLSSRARPRWGVRRKMRDTPPHQSGGEVVGPLNGVSHGLRGSYPPIFPCAPWIACGGHVGTSAVSGDDFGMPALDGDLGLRRGLRGA